MPAPETCFGVGQTVPLLRKRAQRLAEHLPAPHFERRLARFRCEERSSRADDVAQIGGCLEQLVEIVSDFVLLEEELEAPRPVLEVGKLHLPHISDQHEPPSERYLLARFG